MKNLKKYNVLELQNNELIIIDGGVTDPAEGSYNLGYQVGQIIRVWFKGVSKFKWIGVSL
tara:strand:- start:488 stop:667 length:180 start_codon:yes stop_codon:yes gene_type:complete